MSIHQHTGYGRTRRPKNITGTDGTAITNQAAHPTNIATGNDDVMPITGVSISAPFLDLTVADGQYTLANDVIYITGMAPPRLNRSYKVHAKPNANTIRLLLDHELKSIVDLSFGTPPTPAISGTIRRRTKIGYSTENQRFLHLITGSDGTVVNVWAYTYAAGVWTQLKTLRYEIHTESGDDADDPDVRTYDVVASSTVSTHLVIPIEGIDRLAFKITNTVYAAISTF